MNPLAEQLFLFDPPRSSPLKDASGDGGSHQPSRGQEHNRHWRDQRPQSPWFPHLSQTMGMRATRVHYQWLPQCCLGLTGQVDLDIPGEVDSIERKEFT